MSRDKLSVPCPLRAAALYAPDAGAIIGSQGTITYDELDGRVAAAAFRLRELEPGSRVALYLPKDERYVTLMLAVIRAGHVACPSVTVTHPEALRSFSRGPPAPL